MKGVGESRNIDGFSLLELVMAMFILAMAIVPMVTAYTPALLSATEKEEMVVFANQVRGTMHRVLSLDFETLNANREDPVNLTNLFGSGTEAAKETFSLGGQSYTPSVTIADISGGSEGLLELTVTLQRVTLKTLKGRY
jgi:prepilin-type N-terminal cleavage/methylation domain-containing protein